jgi:hypothetical protein
MTNQRAACPIDTFDCVVEAGFLLGSLVGVACEAAFGNSFNSGPSETHAEALNLFTAVLASGCAGACLSTIGLKSQESRFLLVAVGVTAVVLIYRNIRRQNIK